MSLESEDLSARLLAIEAIVGHLLVHLAVRDEDPPRWLATRKTLALHAAHSFAQDGDANGLAHAMSDAIAAFFDDVEAAVCAAPSPAALTRGNLSRRAREV